MAKKYKSEVKILNEAFKKSGKTRTELARMAGIDKTTVYSVFDGWHEPTEDTLGKIAAALGITITVKTEIGRRTA